MPPLLDVDVSGTLPSVRQQIDEARARVQARPTRAEANGTLGMTLHAYRYFAGANAAYHRARLLDPRSAKWRYLNGVTLAELGDAPSAIALFDSVMASEPDRFAPKMALAKARASVGDYAAAIGLATELADAFPSNAESHFELGRMLHVSGEHAKAQQHLERALQLGGDFGAANYVLAGVHRALGDTETSRRYAERYPATKGKTLSRDDPWMSAVHELDNGLKRRQARAEALYARGDLQRAVEILEGMLLEDSENEIAAATLVGIYAEMERFDLSEKLFERALAMDPNLAELHYNRGIALTLEKRWVEAGRAFEKAIRINPSNPDFHARLGLVHIERRDETAAVGAFVAALDVAPDYGPAHQMLADMARSAQRFDEAIPHYRWLTRSPLHSSAQNWYHLAVCHEAQERADAAVDALHAARDAVDAQKERSLASKIDRHLSRLAAGGVQ